MATIKTFRAVRPAARYAHKVAALPYDVYNTQEAKEAAADNPYSFLHIDKPEIDLPEGTDPHSIEVYNKAKENLEAFSEKGVLIQDEKPCLYIYSLTMEGRIQTGIVCCSSVDDYINGVIKRHELTREDKEQDRINHVDHCNANTGPIFLTYKSKDGIQDIVKAWTSSKDPVYDFTAPDGIGHRVWIIDDVKTTKTLTDLFATVENTYIADGHHRTASAVKVALKRRADNPAHKGDEEYNFFLSVLFPDEELQIFDYNRVVKDLNGLNSDEFINRLKDSFDLSPVEDNRVRPSKKGEMSMYLDKKWYKLVADENLLKAENPVERLDVSILQEKVLKDILDIRDIRTDERIDFVGGIRGLGELERRCSLDMKVAFAMYPTSIDELIEISDAGLLMPPKSTWFEPKLRSGLFIHNLY
ncbi:DUF1015 domain-containing protein [Alkalibacter mobilis]|uniref:DUF1015 domain-containing protein n=1 Tax=Alkalibacter mobilis TaxID=2787712 RepID=UPI00189FD53C|nr:DUF1015 family protein [Alkalibacter mobilis]MBF7097647.1 DUF1015 domain-containing protein [Alkalibacter mobilis]